MNELVEYLLEHYNPGGNAIKHVGVDQLLKKTGWTRSEIFRMAYEAREAQFLSLALKTGYSVSDMDPEGLELIGVWNEVYRKMGLKD